MREKVTLQKRNIALGKGEALILAYSILHTKKKGNFTDNTLLYTSKTKTAVYETATKHIKEALNLKETELTEIQFYIQDAKGIIKSVKYKPSKEYKGKLQHIALLTGIEKDETPYKIFIGATGTLLIGEAFYVRPFKHELSFYGGCYIVNSVKYGFKPLFKATGNPLEVLINEARDECMIKDAKTGKQIGEFPIKFYNDKDLTYDVMKRDDTMSFTIDMSDDPLRPINAHLKQAEIWYIPAFKQVKFVLDYHYEGIEVTTYAPCKTDIQGLNNRMAYYIGAYRTECLKGSKVTIALQKEKTLEFKCFINDNPAMLLVPATNRATFGEGEAIRPVSNEEIATLGGNYC